MPKNSFLIEVYLESIGLGVFFDSIFPFHADCLEILLIISSHYFLILGIDWEGNYNEYENIRYLKFNKSKV
jgi:hypothetical protein